MDQSISSVPSFICIHFYRTFCKQTTETLIRRRVLSGLIWVCNVCLRPTKRALDMYKRFGQTCTSRYSASPRDILKAGLNLLKYLSMENKDSITGHERVQRR